MGDPLIVLVTLAVWALIAVLLFRLHTQYNELKQTVDQADDFHRVVQLASEVSKELEKNTQRAEEVLEQKVREYKILTGEASDVLKNLERAQIEAKDAAKRMSTAAKVAEQAFDETKIKTRLPSAKPAPEPEPVLSPESPAAEPEPIQPPEEQPIPREEQIEPNPAPQADPNAPVGLKRRIGEGDRDYVMRLQRTGVGIEEIAQKSGLGVSEVSLMIRLVDSDG